MKSVPSVPGEILGNTEPKSLSSDEKLNAKINYCFTLNNYLEEDKTNFEKWANCATIYWGYGEEVGESGTPHLQGFFKLKKKERITGLKKKLNERYHFAETKGSLESNIVYCSKDGKFKSFNLPEVKKEPIKVKVLKDDELRPFQKEIIEYILNNEAEGKIYWVYDEMGQCGKTETLRKLHIEYKIPFSYGGKCADIINLVFNNKETIIREEKPALIYNFGRETKPKEISYKSMEQVADGCISNTKFEAGCFVCNKIKVIVLSNCLPLFEKMTASRWIVKYINENYELKDWEKPSNDLDV